MSPACALAVPSNKAGSRIHIPFMLFLPNPIASLAFAGAGRQKYFAEIGEMKWRLLLPGASEPRLTELNPLGLQSWFFKPLTRPEQPEHSCRLQLVLWPDNGGTMPSKSSPFTPSSILVRPRQNPAATGLGWSRRVLPPGPKGLLRRPFIAIAGLPRHLSI